MIRKVNKNKIMEIKDQKYLEFLLADFKTIKSEIVRRSNLQKAVNVSMPAFYARVFKEFLSPNAEIVLIFVIWIVSILGFTFYFRESNEIKRLGWAIKDKIAKPVGQQATCLQVAC